MALYPPALIYLVLPLSWSLSFFCLVHQFWAGLGMYFLVKRWTGSPLGAALGGMMFAFNGLTVNLLMWPSHIATLAWMPWVVGTVERAWREGGRTLVVAALVGALQMLAGGPETILLTWLALLGLWMTDLVKGGDSTSSRRHSQQAAMLWRFSLVVALVAALAAAQLLPFLDLATHSQRQAGYADSRWSMPAYGWANFLVPMAFGRVWPNGVFFQYFQSWTSSYYLGIGGALLALFGAWILRERRAWVLIFMSCAGLFIAFGDQTFVYRWLSLLVPQLSLITNPVKFVLPAVFAAPVLAGGALARIGRSRDLELVANRSEGRQFERRLVAITGILIAVIVVILLVARQFPFPEDNYPATLRNGLSRVVLLVACLALLILFARNSSVRRRSLLSLALLAVFWLDFRTHEPNQNPTVSRAVYTPDLAKTKLDRKPQPALGQSRAMLTPRMDATLTELMLTNLEDNFLQKRLDYFANCNLLDGVPKVNGFFSLYPAECGELNAILYGSLDANFPHVEDLLSVSQVTAAEKPPGWVARDSWLPMVTAGQKPLFYKGTNEWYALTASNFDPGTMVILPSELRPYVSVTHQATAHVLESRFTPQRVNLSVEALEPALVVISQTYYHAWRAFLDGQPTRLLRANYAFQAVEVPRGQHHVQLVYQDNALCWGAVISSLTLIGCILSWFRLRSGTGTHFAAGELIEASGSPPNSEK